VRARAPHLALVAPFFVLACGTNRPEIPPELLAPTAGCEAAGYPSGPYGVQEDATAENLCFRGWRRPNETAHTSTTLEDLSFASFHDETGETFELLLVNSAALWCTVCLSEHRELPARYQELGPRGLVILSALFQDARAEPADVEDLGVWVETFDVTFPMVLDSSFQLGAYASADTAPLNLVIDARTMQILRKYVGDQSTLLWDFVETELGRREALE
jgi:hypothetical protein